MTRSVAIESTEQLRAAAAGMESVHAAVQSAVRTLSQTLSSLGDPITLRQSPGSPGAVAAPGTEAPPWGTDSYGKQFASGSNGYTAMSVSLLQGGADMAWTLGEFARGMSQAATGLAAGEQTAADSFR